MPTSGRRSPGNSGPSEFRKLIEPQVGELHSLEKQPQLTVLAATIPEDSTRAILAKLLRKHWSDGPKALETAGLIDRAITDPGLLPIIKMSGKRKESPSTPRVMDAASRRGRGPGSGSPSGGRVEAAQKQLQARTGLDGRFRQVGVRLVQAILGRGAGQGRKRHVGQAGGRCRRNQTARRFRVARDGESGCVASRRFARSDAGRLLASAAEHAGSVLRPREGIGQAEKGDRRTIAGKRWPGRPKLEPLREKLGSKAPCRLPQKDRRRSVDVLITRPEAAPLPPAEKGKERAVAEDEVDLTIEVLIIEIKDPTKEPAKEAMKGSARR